MRQLRRLRRPPRETNVLFTLSARSLDGARDARARGLTEVTALTRCHVRALGNINVRSS
jgi:hypothetical protein